jgi:hypothetical protein
MKVQIIDEAEVIWERDQNGSGIASRAYVADGTQQRIIDALRHALEQAEGQLRTFDYGDSVLDSGTAAA